MQIKAYKLLTSSPSDTTGIERLFGEQLIEPSEVICIIGKTEGKGGRTDFTRDVWMLGVEEFFSDRIGIGRKEVGERIIFSLSGGCEGVVSPHIIVFGRSGKT